MTTTATLSEPIILHALPTVGCYYADDEGNNWALANGEGETCAVCGLRITNLQAAYLRGKFPYNDAVYVHPEHIQHGADIPPAPPSPYTSDEVTLRYEAQALLKTLGKRMDALVSRVRAIADTDANEVGRLNNLYCDTFNAWNMLNEFVQRFAPLNQPVTTDATDTTDAK